MARKKEFDRTEVLSKAMIVFWSQGYEKTSVQDLVTAMGIQRGSIYDTFGDKKHLFEEALSLYGQWVQQEVLNHLSSEMLLVEKLRSLFMFSITQSDSQHPGCLIVNSVAELAVVDPDMGEKLKKLFAKEEQLLLELLRVAQETDELSTEADIGTLAAYLHNAWVGIRVLVKSENESEKLQRIIEQTLLGLPILKK